LNVPEFGWSYSGVLAYARFIGPPDLVGYVAVLDAEAGSWFFCVPANSAEDLVLLYLEGPYTFEEISQIGQLEPDRE
jgi:hypothetical protein